MFILVKLSESKLPNPSSITMKLGRGKLDMFNNAVLIANEVMNFSMPEVNSIGQKFVSSYRIPKNTDNSVKLDKKAKDILSEGK